MDLLGIDAFAAASSTCKLEENTSKWNAGRTVTQYNLWRSMLLNWHQQWSKQVPVLENFLCNSPNLPTTWRPACASSTFCGRSWWAPRSRLRWCRSGVATFVHPRESPDAFCCKIWPMQRLSVWTNLGKTPLPRDNAWNFSGRCGDQSACLALCFSPSFFGCVLWSHQIKYSWPRIIMTVCFKIATREYERSKVAKFRQIDVGRSRGPIFLQVSGNTFVFSLGSCALWTCPSKASLEQATADRPGTLEGPAVFSELCNYQEPVVAQTLRRNPVFVKLWEWNYVDIALECQEFLGPNGFDGVQVSPVTEHILGPQWWTKYQPVSFSLTSRSGSMEDFSAMVKACRAAGVQVIVDLIINHIASPCKEAKQLVEAKSNPPGFLKETQQQNLTPCVGWNGSFFGNRRLAGGRGWDAAGPELFHHQGSLMENCFVGPPGWSCGGGGNDVTDCSCLAQVLLWSKHVPHNLGLCLEGFFPVNYI